MPDILDEVKRLKASAKANRDFEDYDESLGDLQAAVDMLSAELATVEGGVLPYGDAQDDRRPDLARELADCYGMMGGIYRRKGELAQSIKMYDEGFKLESTETYGISDSYSLSNAIVIRILNDPNSLASLEPMIRRAVTTVEKQVEGRRREQWWAWADLGLLYLLSGNESKALEAYEQFKSTGALIQHYESSIAVLMDLHAALGPMESPMGASLARAIRYLKQNKPTR